MCSVCDKSTYMVELLLEFLVGVVDAELLKAVLLEHLKAIDVQDADGGVALLGGAEGVVEAGHRPLKEVDVEVLGQTISGSQGLHHVTVT